MKIKRSLCRLFSVILIISMLFVTVNAFVRGDADGNGKVDASDARLTLRHAVGLDTLTEECFSAADYDKNGKIEASDARMILRLSVGLEKPDTAEQLADSLDFSSSAGKYPEKSSAVFQDMEAFCGDSFTFYGITQSGLNYTQKFTGLKSDIDIIKAYAQLLCRDEMNFTLTDDYLFDYKEIFAEYVIDYTGTANVRKTCTSVFLDTEKVSAINIYYKTDKSRVEGYITRNVALDSKDLGFRYGGEAESGAPAGESACAGLIRDVDGLYKTTDGRFSLPLNGMAVYVNGKAEEGSFRYIKSAAYSDTLIIKDGNNKEAVRLFLPSRSYESGNLWEHNALAREYQWSMEIAPSITTETARIYNFVGASWLNPTYKESPYEDVTVRVMYYDEQKQLSVIYIYTEIIDKQEILCVIDLSKAEKADNSSDGGFSPSVGGNESSVCFYCGGKGYTACSVCGGDGIKEDYISTPNYGGGSAGGSSSVAKKCPSVTCDNGRKDCPYC